MSVLNWETRPVVKEDGEFVKSMKLINMQMKYFLPEMKKVFPNASIKKDIIGEIVGFDRDR